MSKKRLYIIIIAIMFLIIVFAIGNTVGLLKYINDLEDINKYQTAYAQINIVNRCSSIDEAEEVTGFGFEAPQTVLNDTYVLSDSSIATVGEDIIQLVYLNANGDYILLRKGNKRDSLLTGDFKKYSSVSVISTNIDSTNVEIIIKGDTPENPLVSYFKIDSSENEGFYFALIASDPIPKSELEDIVYEFVKYERDNYFDLYDLFKTDPLYSGDNEKYNNAISVYQKNITKDFVKQIAEENQEVGTPKFSLAHITGELDNPQLCLAWDTSKHSGVYVFGVIDGNLIQYGEYGNSGYFYYNPNKNGGIIYPNYGNMGYFYSPVILLEEGETELVGIFIECPENDLYFFFDKEELPPFLTGKVQDEFFDKNILIPDINKRLDEDKYVSIEEKIVGQKDQLEVVRYSDMLTISLK